MVKAVRGVEKDDDLFRICRGVLYGRGVRLEEFHVDCGLCNIGWIEVDILVVAPRLYVALGVDARLPGIRRSVNRCCYHIWEDVGFADLKIGELKRPIPNDEKLAEVLRRSLSGRVRRAAIDRGDEVLAEDDGDYTVRGCLVPRAPYVVRVPPLKRRGVIILNKPALLDADADDECRGARDDESCPEPGTNARGNKDSACSHHEAARELARVPGVPACRNGPDDHEVARPWDPSPLVQG